MTKADVERLLDRAADDEMPVWIDAADVIDLCEAYLFLQDLLRDLFPSEAARKAIGS